MASIAGGSGSPSATARRNEFRETVLNALGIPTGRASCYAFANAIHGVLVRTATA